MVEMSDFDLECWYLNPSRLAQLLGLSESIVSAKDDLRGLDHLRLVVDLKNRLVAYLKKSKIETIEQQLISGTLDVRKLFTAYRHFYFKGLSKVAQTHEPIPRDAVAEMYSKLDRLPGPPILRIPYNPVNLCVASAWSKLVGHNRVFVFGYVENIDDKVILARPFAVADILSAGPPEALGPGPWATYGELHVDQIENFSRVRDIRPSRTVKSLDRLRTTPERTIKEIFARIIGEPIIPKDWGGEKSDLFSTHVRVDGRRISTAFAFKGPAKFGPLTPAGLGKSGNQIGRLFSEPADLTVLQHCHIITGDVREMMRAFSNQIGRPRMFCLIDGFDTIRVIDAYGTNVTGGA